MGELAGLLCAETGKPAPAATPPPSPNAGDAAPEGEEREVQPTLGFQRVLQRAVFHVQSSGRKEVGVANVFVAIFGEKQSHAVFLLGRQDVSRLDVVNYVSHGMSKLADERASEAKDEAPPAAAGAPAPPRASRGPRRPCVGIAGRAIRVAASLSGHAAVA